MVRRKSYAKADGSLGKIAETLADIIVLLAIFAFLLGFNSSNNFLYDERLYDRGGKVEKKNKESGLSEGKIRMGIERCYC